MTDKSLTELAQDLDDCVAFDEKDKAVIARAVSAIRQFSAAAGELPELRVYAIPEGPMVSYDLAYELRTAAIAARAECERLRKAEALLINWEGRLDAAVDAAIDRALKQDGAGKDAPKP